MTRAPVKLSREMKVLLGLLLLVAAIGLWYILTSQRSAGDDLTATQPPVSTEPGTTVPVAPDPEDNPQGNPDTVQPDGTVDVEVIPPFPTGGAPDPDAEPTDVPPTPGGINPDTALSSVPGNNPFRPLEVKATEGAAGTTTTGPTPAPVAVNTPDQSAGQPTGSVTPITSTGGALGLGPLAGSEGDSSGSSSGPIPVPQIPGGDGAPSVGEDSGSSGAGPVVVTPLPTTDQPVVVGGRTPSSGASGAGGNPAGGNGDGSAVSGGTAGAPGAGGPATARPPAPPVAGVQVPGVTRLPSGAASTPGAGGTPGTGASGTGTPGGSDTLGSAGAGTPVTAAPTPGTPQVITDLSAPPSTSTPAATSNPLDSFVQTQQLAFNAVVLGPVNTAIFRSKDGFVVVSVGQTLPDTQVTVKEVTATSATLSLGNNTTTLELEKR
ncbi:hypothetical protein [Deinococcus arcticus]|uniref:Uncharacterized protein n=1 Tax=Deinococcus arcticus TaxID=2136176 RepID=A0A2T3W601_9DEIO|nr:hypothetical protein [Deinococcus arcticus]PTA67309.1 hypothetical protein C8263_13485 [Deinococcus arcticus]